MSKHRIPHKKWMEFVDEIATQLTENTYGEDTFENYRGEGEIHFKEEAKSFYNERYDEVETLLENMLDITSDKPEYYEK